MLTAIVLITFALTMALDWFPGIRTKPKKESVVYGLMMAAALAVLVLYSVGIKVANPSGAIRSVVSAIFPIK
jgi:hypothetical protein